MSVLSNSNFGKVGEAGSPYQGAKQTPGLVDGKVKEDPGEGGVVALCQGE